MTRMTGRRFFVPLLLGLSVGLAGCTSVDINARRSGLMPAQAARAILQRHLGADWAERPYGYTAPICGSERGSFSITEVTGIDYDSYGDRLKITARSGLCGRLIVWQHPIARPAAQEVADALAALGAKVD